MLYNVHAKIKKVSSTAMKKRTLLPLTAWIILICLMVPLIPIKADASTVSQLQSEIDALEEKNQALQAQIDAIGQQYDAAYTEISEIVEMKNALDQEISLLSEKIAAANQQITAYRQLIADTQVELDAAQATLQELSQMHAERIRTMEENGTVSYWQVIFRANSFTDLLDRLTIMQEISEADQKRMRQLRIASDLVEANRISLEKEKGDMEAVLEELTADEVLLEQRRSQSDGLLRELAEQAEEFSQLMAQSEQLQEELMQQIAAKESQLKTAQYNAYLAELAKAGDNPPSDAAWVTPVSGYTLTSPFGMRLHPVLGYEKMHNGIDMACAQGTPIYATRAGAVTTAAYQAGGAGYYVSINHLDGFASIYMHMTHYVVSAGQTVSQGQLIGYVGSTGMSTGPHLHFGISYAGTYVNPLAYIV